MRTGTVAVPECVVQDFLCSWTGQVGRPLTEQEHSPQQNTAQALNGCAMKVVKVVRQVWLEQSGGPPWANCSLIVDSAFETRA